MNACWLGASQLIWGYWVMVVSITCFNDVYVFDYMYFYLYILMLKLILYVLFQSWHKEHSVDASKDWQEEECVRR